MKNPKTLYAAIKYTEDPIDKAQEALLSAEQQQANRDARTARIVAIGECVISYVIGVDDAYACQRKLKEHLNEQRISAQRFRLMLADFAYIHINVKFFVLNVLRAKIGRDRAIEKFGDMFSIDEKDRALFSRILKIRGFIKHSKEHVSKINLDHINFDAYKNVFVTFNAIYPDLMRHIKHKTYTKLRFVSSSANIEFYDFHIDLMCKALQTYMRMIPTQKSELHIANYIRNTLNNHTINIIKSSTTKKRARLVKAESDGFGGNRFEIVTASENQLFRAFGLEESVSYDSLRNSDDNLDEEQRRVSDLNFDRVLSKFGTTSKKRLLIELLSCQENEKFTAHLKENCKISETEDNVDFHTHAGERKYFSEVCQFLKIGKRKARRFVKYLGAIAYPEMAKARR